MSRFRRLRLAARFFIPAFLLLGACGSGGPEIAAVQHTIVRDVANAGGTGSRENLSLAEFLQDEFGSTNPTISWASARLAKEGVDAARLSVTARIESSEAGFPKVTLRFTYDPATQKVAYRDMLVGKKPFVGRDGRQIALASTYETIKSEVQAKALAKVKEKAKKKAASDLKKKNNSKDQNPESQGAT